jgi:outer membrane receptor protein involved in Fe transport
VSATHARFRGSDLVQKVAYYNILSGGSDADALFPLNVRGNSPGNFLTNAPTVVATGGVEAGEKTGWFGALRYRYFGSRPLTEDGQIRSIAAGTLNLRAGYRFDNGWKAQIDAFNITNNRGDAIAYGYGSFVRQDLLFFQHPGESIGIMDRHFKPVDPPAVRMTLAGPLAIFDGYLGPRW